MKGNVAISALLAFGLALGACSDKKPEDVDPNLFPKDYQKQILLTLTGLLDDPTNIRDAGITEPTLHPAANDQRYAVCVRYNARNAARHYEGVKERIAYFYGGQLNQLILADQGQCAGAVYKPWPELEKYCLAKSCA